MNFDPHEIIEEIKEQYLEEDNRPWIVGFSGGKDSTTLLQLVWYAIRSLPEYLNHSRKVYVVCNNTLVENPKILEYTYKVLDRIQKAASEQSLPIFVVRTTPVLEDTFWVNLIGRGYPAPNNVFRWCTERLKINPTTKFILEKTNTEGEVIILLGTRKAESSRRSQSMKRYEVKGQRLRKHVLPSAYVYTPIKDLETNDVWTYLQQVPSPWEASNKELVSLYRNANSGDCPLVIDKTTPSCGHSRFGCWVCTVVSRDKSMEALIENGEEWMEPLMELRDLLAESRDSEKFREAKRRDGTKKEGIMGPYKSFFRAEVLKLVLKAQKEIQETNPEINLINYQELVAIQVNWYRDFIFNFKVADIYKEVYGFDININAEEENNLQEKKLLKEVCNNHPGEYKLINELLSLQKSKTLLMNKRGLQTDLENRLQEFINSDMNA
jgi:DNA sulfur modification protein DndC